MSIRKFIRFVLRNSKLIIVLTILVTVFMGWKAADIGIDTDVNNLTPRQNDRIDKIRTELGIEKEITNFVFISIYGNDLYNLKVLQEFQNTIDAILDIPEIIVALSPFNFISFDAEGRRIIPATVSPTGRAPLNLEELEIFEKRVRSNSLSRNLVVSDNGRILTAAFISRTVVDSASFMISFDAAIKPLKEVVRVYHTGEIPFQERVAFYLLRDFSRLMILALITMLTIFWLSFRSLRAVILPVMVTVVGTIWTLGVMSMIGFKITVLTVIVPALVLTIGSSYTIHILNEYYRIEKSGETEKMQWLTDAVEHVIRTVIIAALTTMISFLSLLTTTIRPLREFGLSISLGIFFCAILALSFLPSVFYILKTPPAIHRKRIKDGPIISIVTRFGQWASRYRYILLASFILLFVFFLSGYPHILHQSDYFSYFPSDDPLIIGSQFINEHSGGSQTFNITLTAANGEKNFFLNPKILSLTDRFETVLSEHPSVTSKRSFIGILKAMNEAVNGEETVPESRGLILLLYRYFSMIPRDKIIFGQDSSIINDDASQITVYLKLAETDTYSMINENDVRKFQDFVNDESAVYFDDSVEINVWGNTLLIMESSRTIKRDQLRSTLISITLGMIVTWIFFRSFVFSLIALVPLLSGIFFYFITLYLTRIPLDLTTILVTNVTVGVGLDDAVHFILQYRKQRLLQPYDSALSSSLHITGRPIVLTTFSLVAGLLVLCFASFKPVVFFGFLIAGTLFSTMTGTVIFIPAAITFYERIRNR